MTIGISQVLVIRTIWFNSFINNSKARTQCTFSNFMDKKKWGSGWYTGGQNCYSEGPEKAGKMRSVMQFKRQMQTPTYGIEHIPRTRKGWHLLARQWLWRKGSEGPWWTSWPGVSSRPCHWWVWQQAIETSWNWLYRNIFSTMVKRWNRLPREDVAPPYLEIL